MRYRQLKGGDVSTLVTRLTFGLRFSAVDAFDPALTKAFTTFFSLSGAPPRNDLRIRSSAKICLILEDLRSNSLRNFLRGSASGCQSPPPCTVSEFEHDSRSIGLNMNIGGERAQIRRQA